MGVNCQQTPGQAVTNRMHNSRGGSFGVPATARPQLIAEFGQLGLQALLSNELIIEGQAQRLDIILSAGESCTAL